MVKITVEYGENIKKFIRKKKILQTVIRYKLKGYSYKTAKRWGQKIYYDLKKNHNGKSIKEKKWAHRRGFLSDSIDKYGLTEKNYRKILSDFEYTFLTPINNDYEKWLTDRLTPHYILIPYKKLLPEVYYSIITRNGIQKIISLKDGNRVVNTDAVLELLREKKKLLLLPSQSSHIKYSYLFEYKHDKFYVNNAAISIEAIGDFFRNLKSYFIIKAYNDTSKDVKSLFNDKEVIFKFILSNTDAKTPDILASYVEVERPYIGGRNTQKRFRKKNFRHIIIDKNNGTFNWKMEDILYEETVPRWNDLCKAALEIASFMSQIEYMMIAFKITDDGIKLVGHGRMPKMPEGTTFDSDINKYLKDKSQQKKQQKWQKNKFKNNCKAIILNYLRKHKFRKGFRLYMVSVWLNVIKDDLKNTHMPLKKKLWAWKRGYPSYRIEQYHLTEENWKNFLSEYNYAWLNRLNNTYQKWLNDKTTMRYVLEPMRQYLPEYYYFICKRNGAMYYKKLQDCPNEFENSSGGIMRLLEKKKKLVFKPNSGSHGGGFYKIEQLEGKIFVNDEVASVTDLISLLNSQKDTYVITEYIEMNHALKQIYDKSVNTVRIMVLNESCDTPRIVQTYMRVGTSHTGVTDNIAFGGIAVYVEPESGVYYGAELLRDHKYVKIEKHPDTGIPITGVIPYWNFVKKGVIEISRYLPQLEYLGFDIAITDYGFKILEINIHQDIHKAHEYSREVNNFFKKKVEYKKKLYGIQ